MAFSLSFGGREWEKEREEWDGPGGESGSFHVSLKGSHDGGFFWFFLFDDFMHKGRRW